MLIFLIGSPFDREIFDLISIAIFGWPAVSRGIISKELSQPPKSTIVHIQHNDKDKVVVLATEREQVFKEHPIGVFGPHFKIHK